MYRLICPFVIAATLFSVQIPTAAKASTVSYNLSLTPILGPESGTGSLTITVPPVGSSGFLTLANGGLAAMDFMIDGLDFKLNNSSEVSYFYRGSNLVLASLGYSGAIGSNQMLSLSLGGFGAYFFSDNTPGESTIGNVSVSATPLPTTLPLLATGLGGLGLFGWWRKRKASAALAAA
jgi:hypothetical protein